MKLLAKITLLFTLFLFNSCGGDEYPIKLEFKDLEFLETQFFYVDKNFELINLRPTHQQIQDTLESQQASINILINDSEDGFDDSSFNFISDTEVEVNLGNQSGAGSYSIDNGIISFDGETSNFIIDENLTEMTIESFYGIIENELFDVYLWDIHSYDTIEDYLRDEVVPRLTKGEVYYYLSKVNLIYRRA